MEELTQQLKFECGLNFFYRATLVVLLARCYYAIVKMFKSRNLQFFSSRSRFKELFELLDRYNELANTGMQWSDKSLADNEKCIIPANNVFDELNKLREDFTALITEPLARS